MFWENSIETCILSRVKQITSPGWMHGTSAQTWCTGKTQRNQAEREVGGGIRMGNTCISKADSCHVWQKPLQYCKVISLQLIKKNEFKKCMWSCTHSTLCTDKNYMVIFVFSWSLIKIEYVLLLIILGHYYTWFLCVQINLSIYFHILFFLLLEVFIFVFLTAS